MDNQTGHGAAAYNQASLRTARFAHRPPRVAAVAGSFHDGSHDFRITRRGPLHVLERKSRGAPGLQGIVSPPGTWEPRILFDTRTSRPRSHYEPGLAAVQDPKYDTIFTRSPFATRTRPDGVRVTLNGNTFKLTNGPEVLSSTRLATQEEYFACLSTNFNMSADAPDAALRTCAAIALAGS